MYRSEGFSMMLEKRQEPCHRRFTEELHDMIDTWAEAF
jgi:hypothetical protein